MKDNYGVRLYEVNAIDDSMYILFAHNYSTDKNFVMRKVVRKN